jgi:hypothetical protein
MRAAIIALSSSRHRLTISLHRIVCDDESLRVFRDELLALWCVLAKDPGRHASTVLPPTPIQYLDLADYLDRLAASPAGQLQQAYWRERLAGAMPLELPIDRPRDEVERVRDERAGFVAFPVGFARTALASESAGAVRRLAARERAPIHATLLAAMAAYLHRRSGQTDLSIVSHLIYRHLPGLNRALGLFSNPLVVRISTAGTPSFRELVARTRDVVTSAYTNGECDVLGIASHRAFRLWFNYLYVAPSNDNAQPALPAGLAMTPAALPASAPRSAYDLLLTVRNNADGILLLLAYNLALFQDATARGFLDGFVAEIERMCAAPDQPI